MFADRMSLPLSTSLQFEMDLLSNASKGSVVFEKYVEENQSKFALDERLLIAEIERELDDLPSLERRVRSLVRRAGESNSPLVERAKKLCLEVMTEVNDQNRRKRTLAARPLFSYRSANESLATQKTRSSDLRWHLGEPSTYGEPSPEPPTLPHKRSLPTPHGEGITPTGDRDVCIPTHTDDYARTNRVPSTTAEVRRKTSQKLRRHTSGRDSKLEVPSRNKSKHHIGLEDGVLFKRMPFLDSFSEGEEKKEDIYERNSEWSSTVDCFSAGSQRRLISASTHLELYEGNSESGDSCSDPGSVHSEEVIKLREEAKRFRNRGSKSLDCSTLLKWRAGVLDFKGPISWTVDRNKHTAANIVELRLKFGILMEGLFLKRCRDGKRFKVKEWRKYYGFLLSNGFLLYFRSMKSKSIVFKKAADFRENQTTIISYNSKRYRKDSFRLDVRTAERKWSLSFGSKEDLSAWYEVINRFAARVSKS